MFIPNMNKLQYTGCGSGANQLLCHTKLPVGLGYMKVSSNWLCNNQTLEHCMAPSCSHIIAFFCVKIFEEPQESWKMRLRNWTTLFSWVSKTFLTDIIWPLHYVTQWTFSILNHLFYFKVQFKLNLHINFVNCWTSYRLQELL